MVAVNYDNGMEMYGDEKLHCYLEMQAQRFHRLGMSMMCLVPVKMSVWVEQKGSPLSP